MIFVNVNKCSTDKPNHVNFFYKQYFLNITYTRSKHGLANMTFKNKNTLKTPSSGSPRHNDNWEPEDTPPPPSPSYKYLKHKSTL